MKEVVTEQDEDDVGMIQPDSMNNGDVCSAEGCGQPSYSARLAIPEVVDRPC